LPADDQDPKGAGRDFHAGQPGDAREAERLAASGTTVPAL
jgi:hypothetical protein